MIEKPSIEEFQHLVSGFSPAIQQMVRELHDFLIDLECSSYIKTIYIGYEIGGEMVAALYPYHKHVDIALAIPEETSDSNLMDASHLTWRSLPLLVTVRNMRDVGRAKKYLIQAANRIRAGTHRVYRDNEYFIRTKSDRDTKRNSLRRLDS